MGSACALIGPNHLPLPALPPPATLTGTLQSDRKSRLITICMLVSAIVMIGLALTGTLQMRVSHSPITALSQIDRR